MHIPSSMFSDCPIIKYNFCDFINAFAPEQSQFVFFCCLHPRKVSMSEHMLLQ